MTNKTIPIKELKHTKKPEIIYEEIRTPYTITEHYTLKPTHITLNINQHEINYTEQITSIDITRDKTEYTIHIDNNNDTYNKQNIYTPTLDNITITLNT